MTALTLAAMVTFPDGLPTGGGQARRFGIYKAEPNKPAFKKVGSGVSLRAGVEIDRDGATFIAASDVSVLLPTLVPGTDYRIAFKANDSLQAYTYADTLPSGAVVIGGFHYAPGGAPVSLGAGGSWTPTIAEPSMWDINFGPNCLPLGMAKVGHRPEWLDMYFQGNSSNVDGVSRNNDTILTGGNPPLIPADYGGDGTTKYSTMNWWQGNEHLAQFGKRYPSYSLLTLAAFGTNEGDGRGAHPVTTGLNTSNAGPSSDPNFTGRYFHFQISGVLWTPTSDLSYWPGTATANAHGWEAYDVTGGRGKLIMPNDRAMTYILHGGQHSYQLNTSPTGVGAVAGSRSAETIEKLWDSSQNIALRGACDHVQR